MSLPTPSTSHISDQTPVYPPSEDSYLLLDAFSLPSEQENLHARFTPLSPPPFVVELGTGSGIVSAFISAHAATIFGSKNILSLGIDVSKTANLVTNDTVGKSREEFKETAGVWSDSITSDLAGALRSGCVDILVFNPPYVPSEELPSLEPLRGNKHDEEYLLSLTYAGGDKGMETTQRLLDNLDEILSKRGVLYLLLCKSNYPEEVVAGLREKNWIVELVIQRRAGWEKLSIWRISRGAKSDHVDHSHNM